MRAKLNDFNEMAEDSPLRGDLIAELLLYRFVLHDKDCQVLQDASAGHVVVAPVSEGGKSKKAKKTTANSKSEYDYAMEAAENLF